MMLMLQARARLAPEALAELLGAEIKEGVSRVFLLEGEGGIRPVMVMWLLRPVGPALTLEKLVEGLQRVEATELEAEVLGAPRNVVADNGVGWQ